MHIQRVNGELQGVVAINGEEGVGCSCRSLHSGISTETGSQTGGNPDSCQPETQWERDKCEVTWADLAGFKCQASCERFDLILQPGRDM